MTGMATAPIRHLRPRGNGVTQPTSTDVYVTAAQLAQTTYQSGNGTDTLWVRANDGSQWSAWSPSFAVTTAGGGAEGLRALAAHGPFTVVVSDFAAAVGQPLVSTVEEQIEDLGSYLEVRRPGPQSRAGLLRLRGTAPADRAP